MGKTALDYPKLRTLISQGNIDKVLNKLLAFIEGINTNVTKEVYLTSARYRTLELEKLRGAIDPDDYKRECNSITMSLLEIIDSLNTSTPASLKEVPSQERIAAEIEELVKKFHNADTIKSIPSRLRTKIHAARMISEKLILWPELMKKYRGTTELAIICGIGRKVKAVSNIDDLDILESVVPHATTSISKGFIINGLAELIYAGQLRIGDDWRIRELLTHMKNESDDKVVLTNITFVETTLDVLVGIHKMEQ
ncbi:MAG: hypothetical protein AAF806_02260 [Bacteroidota bacterium]